MQILTMNFTQWKFVFLLTCFPFLLNATSENINLKSSNTLDCPTTDLIINSSEVTNTAVNTWLTDNEAAFKMTVNNLGGLWASSEVIITHDYEGVLPSSVCTKEEGGLLVIFKATNSEEDAIRCGSQLIILDNELIISTESELVQFSSSTSLKASIDDWLITYAANLRNQIADGLTKESKEDLIITHDYNGIMPDWTCQAESNNELVVIFTVEDKCGNIATHEKRIVVVDNRPPQLAVLSPIEVERRESFSPESIGFVAVTDECTPTAAIKLTYFDDVTKIDTDTILRKWVATDLCGNADSIMQLIKLVDREQFLNIPCAPENVIISCIGGRANNAALNTWRTQNLEKLANACQSDAMDLSINISDVSLFGAECGRRNGGSILTFTISDGLGNSTIKKAKATIIDNTPPIFGAPMRSSGNICDARSFLNIGLLRNNFINTAYPFALSNLESEKDCSNVQLHNYKAYIGNPNKEFPKRKYERFIFDFRDECGNRNVQTPFYFAQDTLAPKVTCEPLDKVHTCVGDEANELAAITWNATNLQLLTDCSSTECFGIKSITSDYNFIELSGKCSEDKSLTVTYKITDAFDNTTIKLATFSISTTDSLQVTCEPEDATHACNGAQRNEEAAAAWNATNIQLLRDCAASQCEQIRVSSDYSFTKLSNQCGLTGELIVNYLIEDGCSSIVKTATFSIIDNRDPNPVAFVFDRTIMCEEDNGILEEAIAWNEMNLNNLRRAADDNCGNVSVSSNFDTRNISKACGLTGAVNIIYTITDECGLTATKEAEFKVEDNTPPVVNCFPRDLMIGCLATTEREETVEFWNQKNINLLTDCANDNCGDFTVVSDLDHDLINGNCVEEKDVFVTYTVMDDCGNATRLTATIKELQDTIYTPNCANVMIEIIGNQVSIFNLEAPYVILTIFDDNWETVYECNGDCREDVTVMNLDLAALYHVKVHFFDVNQQLICERIEDITTDTEPCDLSICQENVVLRTQSDVDAFCGCSVIEGDLKIGSASIFETNDITSLENLSIINTVKGNVSILGTQLINLDGLDNLKDVSGNFGISVNEQLEQIDALKDLNKIGARISIFKNLNLKSIEGFSNLQIKELETLRITGNASLKTLKGFEGLERLYGAGFQGLTIEDNAILEDVSALNSILTIDGKFFVRFNPQLACCSLSHLVDLDNDNGIVRGTITLLNNSEFCNTRADIVQNCFVTPPIACENIQISKDEDNRQIRIERLTAPNEIVKVFDMNYQIISTCTGDCPETITISDLVVGETYHTDIQFYDENWQFICEDKQDIIIEGVNEPCDTSICQGDVILRTQAEVDAFCGCEVIEGDLEIGDYTSENNTDIVDLNNLIKTNTINGSLIIGRTRLKNIHGFNNLTSIGNDLVFINNPLLENFEGLDKLEDVMHTIYIDKNDLLNSLKGLNQLETCGSFNLVFCPSIKSLKGLDNLKLVDRSFIIRQNKQIENTNGIEQLQKTGAELVFFSNPNLQRINGLDNFIRVGGSLVIQENLQLESMIGLTNVQSANQLVIRENPNLSDCCPISHLIDTNPANGQVSGLIEIEQNLLFCNSVEEILQNCQTPLPTCQDIQVHTENNQITIEGLTAPNEIIKIFDKDFNILYECAGDCEETQIAGTFPAGNYAIDIQLYNENWQQICAEQRPITLAEEPIEDCASIEVTSNNRQITVSGLTSTNEKVTITALPEYRSGSISTTTFYQLKGDFTLSEIDGKLILDFADNYIAEDSLPGLYLYLTNDPNGVEDAFEIGPVEIFEGEHSYEIEGVALDEYEYLLYYCKPFRVKVGEGKINTERQTAFECTDDCGDIITTEAFPTGTYQIDITFFSQEGGELCDYQQTITVVSDLPCQDINISTPSNSSELIISTPSVPNAIIKIFDASWQIVYECIATCESELMIPVDGAGIYHTDIQLYDENWAFICEDKRDVEVVENGEPCDTSICQGDVILRTQADVDAFCGCEVVEGDLIIGYNTSTITDIYDLSNLNSLKIIKGILGINGTLITDLDDLDELIEIGSRFYFISNDRVKDFTGLSRLSRINGNVFIDSNDSLSSLQGFDRLDRLTGLTVYTNKNLKNLDDLTNLEFLGFLQSFGNQLENIDFLKQLKNTKIGILITGNYIIENLEGLANFDTLAGITLGGNNSLVDISALQNVKHVQGDLTIEQNPVLEDCCYIRHLVDNDSENGRVAGNIKFGRNGGTNSQCEHVYRLLEQCNVPPSVPCESILIQTANNQLIVSNLNAPIQIVKVFDNNYATVYECFAECAETINLTDLEAGKYHVNINLYNENWEPICERVESVEVGSAQDRSAYLLPQDFALYPNPTTAEVYLNLHQLKGEQVELALFNQFGQRVKEQKIDRVGEQPIKIDLVNQLNGVYILQIIAKGKRPIAKKILVNQLY